MNGILINGIFYIGAYVVTSTITSNIYNYTYCKTKDIIIKGSNKIINYNKCDYDKCDYNEYYLINYDDENHSTIQVINIIEFK